MLIFTFSYTINADEIVDENETTLVTIAPVVSVNGNNNSIILSWNEDTNVSNYIIYRSTDAKKGFKVIANVTTNTYTDKKLSYGTTYYYKVKTQDGKVSKVVSKKVTLNKVMGVSLKESSTSVKITWDRNTAASGYYIYRSTDGKKWTKVKTISKNTTVSYNDNGLKAKTNYYYQVQAYKKVGKKTYASSKSDKVFVKTLFTLPTFTLKPYSLSSVALKLKEISGAEYYEIYLFQNESNAYELYWTATKDDFHKGYLSEHLYVDGAYETIKVKIKACAKNDYCSSYVVKSGKSGLAAPYISILKGGNKYVEARFYSYDGDERIVYELYRSTSKNGKYTKVGSRSIKSSLIIKDKKVSNGKTYYYKVRATMKIGKKVYKSAFSKVESVKTGKNAEILSATKLVKEINAEYPCSKKNLMELLVDIYGYTKTHATKGINAAKINFKTNALRAAKEIIKYDSVVTEDGIRKELEQTGFTSSEIEYALSKINVNWHDNLVKAINRDLEFGVSKEELINRYSNEYSGVTREDVVSVINEMNIDFNNQAVIYANSILEYRDQSSIYPKIELRSELENSDYTTSEIEYALENANIDWIEEIVKDYNSSYGNYCEYCSKQGLINHYTSDVYGFSEEEVLSAIEKLNIDFSESAKNDAEFLSNKYYYSKTEIIESLENEYHYTHDEAVNASQSENIDYEENAYQRVMPGMNSLGTNVTREEVKETLIEIGFTETEATKASEKIEDMFFNRPTEFENTLIQIFKVAQQQAIADSTRTDKSLVYCSENDEKLDIINLDSKYHYFIKFNEELEITTLKVTDGDFQISLDNVNLTSIDDVGLLDLRKTTNVSESDILNITCGL